ncbi:hypothetical protein MHUMG1_02948 [Metarhizium humberi]|uniref:Uncharacterized protein n=1 Tax=Metarhizium humberi TaxID=2596975 RepID=A0A9P8MEN1_9HYPO|nr:hypothetical protein MHUMG1_02948 [Metarhizium humberi]
MQVKQAEPTVGLAGIDRFLLTKKGAMEPLSIAGLGVFLKASFLAPPEWLMKISGKFPSTAGGWGEIFGAQRSDDD